MPFDGDGADIELAAVLNAIGRAARRERKQAAADAVIALTKLLEWFEGGKNWTRGWGRPGIECLHGGLTHVSCGAEDAQAYLYAAIRNETGKQVGIIAYNDSAPDFSAISRVIGQARELAQQVAGGQA